MRLLACLIPFLLLAAPVAAQDERQGIAFAYAPEQGMGVCVGGSPEKTLACARTRCVESGAATEDCARVAWCFPSGWSAAIGVLHREGIHWSEFTCGWPSKDAAVAAGKLRCEHQNKEFITQCSVSVVYDEAGKEEWIDQ